MDKRDGFEFTVCDTDVAIKTISSMQDIIKEYGFATVADLYDLAGVTCKYTDNKYGWSDDITFRLHKLDDDRIVITLPEPKLLDDPFGCSVDLASELESIRAKTYEKMIIDSTHGIPVYNPESLNTHDEKAKSYLDTDDVSPKPDMVNNPPHYQSETGLEVIDVIEAFTFDLKGIEATDTGNAIKYICRWKNKNGVQDLKKAQWYINHLIKHVELLEKENNENNKKEND